MSLMDALFSVPMADLVEQIPVSDEVAAALLKRTGPSFLSLVNYEVPIWAMLFGVLLLGETPPDRAAPALALILGGVAISQGALPAIRRALAGAKGGARAPGA